MPKGMATLVHAVTCEIWHLRMRVACPPTMVCPAVRWLILIVVRGFGLGTISDVRAVRQKCNQQTRRQRRPNSDGRPLEFRVPDNTVWPPLVSCAWTGRVLRRVPSRNHKSEIEILFFFTTDSIELIWLRKRIFLIILSVRLDNYTIKVLDLIIFWMSKQRKMLLCKHTFSTQLLLTSKLPGLISRCRMRAECKYLRPRNIWYRNTLMWSADKCCGDTIILCRSDCSSSVIT